MQPVGAKTCTPKQNALNSLLPEGMMLGGSSTNGDCFFDSVFQGFCALGSIPKIKRCHDVRLAVKNFWDGKSEKEAADDFGALLFDTTINLPSCYAGLDALKKLEGFKNWLAQDPQYIILKLQNQLEKPGFVQNFPTYPYWGGILDFQVT
jgi:hypothetical protein